LLLLLLISIIALLKKLTSSNKAPVSYEPIPFDCHTSSYKRQLPLLHG
jgi:hypothetical protein